MAIRKKIVLLMMSISVLVFSVASLANGTGILSGRVYLSGTPVSGGKVVVSHMNMSSYTQQIDVDGTGSYLITGVPLGDVILRVYGANQELMAEKRVSLTVPDATVNFPISIH